MSLSRYDNKNNWHTTPDKKMNPDFQEINFYVINNKIIQRMENLIKRNKKGLTCIHKDFDKMIKKFVCKYIRVKCHCTIKLNRAIKKLLD